MLKIETSNMYVVAADMQSITMGIDVFGKTEIKIKAKAENHEKCKAALNAELSKVILDINEEARIEEYARKRNARQKALKKAAVARKEAAVARKEAAEIRKKELAAAKKMDEVSKKSPLAQRVREPSKGTYMVINGVVEFISN